MTSENRKEFDRKGTQQWDGKDGVDTTDFCTEPSSRHEDATALIVRSADPLSPSAIRMMARDTGDFVARAKDTALAERPHRCRVKLKCSPAERSMVPRGRAGRPRGPFRTPFAPMRPAVSIGGRKKRMRGSLP